MALSCYASFQVFCCSTSTVYRVGQGRSRPTFLTGALSTPPSLPSFHPSSSPPFHGVGGKTIGVFLHVNPEAAAALPPPATLPPAQVPPAAAPFPALVPPDAAPTPAREHFALDSGEGRGTLPWEVPHPRTWQLIPPQLKPFPETLILTSAPEPSGGGGWGGWGLWQKKCHDYWRTWELNPRPYEHTLQMLVAYTIPLFDKG